jgi:hypothetical protein
MASLAGARSALTPRGTPGLVSWHGAPNFPRTYSATFTQLRPGGIAGRRYGDFTKPVATVALITASDTASLTATEEPFDRNEIATTDTARLSASDVSQLFNRIDSTDMATLTAGETIVLGISGVTLKTASDTASLSANDALILDVTLDVSDTASLTATDVSTLDVSAESFDVTDTANLSADDSVLLEIFAGIVEKSVADTAFLTVNDIAAVMEVRRIRHISLEIRAPRITLEIL